MNPVLLSEWRNLFRGKSPYYFLMFYGALHFLVFSGVVVPVMEETAIHSSALKNAGKLLAGRLFGTQLLLIALTFPALSVWLMTRERERNILQLLRIVPYGFTKVPCWKLITSIIIWMLLIASAAPLFLFSLSTGGISSRDLLLLLALLTAFVICCGVISFLCTLAVKRPEFSLAAAYLSVFTVSIISLSGYLSYFSPNVYKLLSFSF
jgi:hypothetical protein